MKNAMRISRIYHSTILIAQIDAVRETSSIFFELDRQPQASPSRVRRLLQKLATLYLTLGRGTHPTKKLQKKRE